MSARTRKDWILMGCLGCALAGAAHAEYTLALAAHFNKYVALAVPGALDLYVLRALQVRRDVFVAVLVMVAANVTAHLLTAGVLREHWAITSAAGALAPLILWRVHALKHTRTRKELLWGLPAGAVTGEESAPVPEETSAASAPAPVWGPGEHLVGCDGVHALGGPYACARRASALEATAPDHVPASWMDEEYPETYPSAASAGEPCSLYEPLMRPLDDECSECRHPWFAHPEVQARRDVVALEPELGCIWGHDECAYSDGECVVYAAPAPSSAPHPCPLSEPFLRDLDAECSECGGRWGDHPGVQAKRAAHSIGYPDYQDPSALVLLKAVPDLPPEYAEGAVHSESPLIESDLPYVDNARAYVKVAAKPSVRGLRREMKIGQDRAERLLTHLGVLL